MVAVDRYVTEWGFPALRWYDTVADMKGHPKNADARIVTRPVERRLWVNWNGVQVLALDAGKPAVAGHWHEFQGLVVTTSEQYLTPQERRVLAMRQLSYVEHQVLEAHFSDGTVNRIATSAVPRVEMEELHRAISRAFIDGRRNYMPPQDGVCWVKNFTPNMVTLEPGEVSPTRVNVSEAECRSIMITNEAPVPSIHWREPVRTRGWMGFGGVRHHLVARNLFVGRALREGMHKLCFNSYRPGTEGVVEVIADFAFLKGFRVVDSRETYAEALQPLKGTLPGLSVVADFRYGLTLPLTCVWHRDDNARKDVEALAQLCEMMFLPLVGQLLTDEQLGFKTAAKP